MGLLARLLAGDAPVAPDVALEARGWGNLSQDERLELVASRAARANAEASHGRLWPLERSWRQTRGYLGVPPRFMRHGVPLLPGSKGGLLTRRDSETGGWVHGDHRRYYLVKRFLRQFRKRKRAADASRRRMAAARRAEELRQRAQGIREKLRRLRVKNVTVMDAVYTGNYMALVQLLQIPTTKLDGVDEYGHSVLSVGVLCMREDVVGLLLRYKIDPDNPDSNDQARVPLHHACQVEDVRSALQLLAADCDPDAVDAAGMTPLMVAAEIGNEELCVTLIDEMVEIDLKDNYGWTALHYAAAGGHVDVVRGLLENDADVDALDSTNQTAEDWSKAMGRGRVEALLATHQQDRWT